MVRTYIVWVTTMSRSLSAADVLLVGVFLFFALLLVLEKRRPYLEFCARRLRISLSTNAAAFVFNNILMGALSVSSLLAIAAHHSQHGLLSSMTDGPAKWIASFTLFDFAVFLWHFLTHKSEALWRLHKVHHSDKTFHVSTGLRFHVFEQLIEVFAKCVAAVVIGVTAPVVAACEILRMFFVLFHHANIMIPGEKWLSYLIITPSLHRVHHSTLRSEHDSNYGIVLAIWDIIFGTRKHLVPKSIGLNMIEAENFVQLLSLAFITERRLARVMHLFPRKVEAHGSGAA